MPHKAMLIHPHYLSLLFPGSDRFRSGLSGIATIAITIRRRSTSCYRSPENIGIVAIVESERELREIERQIFFAHVVVRADDPALQERPEGIDTLRMYLAAHVLAAAMRNRIVRHDPSEIAIAGMLVGCDQINLIANYLSNEPRQCRGIRVLDHLADDVALAGDRADEGVLPAVPLPPCLLSQWRFLFFSPI